MEYAKIKRVLYVVAGVTFIAATGWFSWRLFLSENEDFTMIPVSAFQQGSADDDIWDFGNLGASGDFGSILAGNPPYDVRLYAPVNLPHGAKVTELTVYYVDRSSDDALLDVDLVYHSTGIGQSMADVFVSTTGSLTSIQSISDNI